MLLTNTILVKKRKIDVSFNLNTDNRTRKAHVNK